jgi:hypothetical protein
MSRRAANLPIVFVEQPVVVCPRNGCDCEDFEMNSSINQGDGSRLRRMRCKACGCRFKLVVEYYRQKLAE